MAQICRKLEPEPTRPRHFLTEPGMGYRFELAPGTTTSRRDQHDPRPPARRGRRRGSGLGCRRLCGQPGRRRRPPPVHSPLGLENIVIVYLAVVAVTAAIGGRAAGLISSLSGALSYNFFFTTPYYTLRIDSASQVFTVVLLFAGGLLASLGGRASRRAGAQVREEADAIRLLHAITLAATSGRGADQTAGDRLLQLLGARSVQVIRGGRVTAQAGEPLGPLDVEALPHLDQDGRIPTGHFRSVGGTLVLPTEGTAIDLVHGGRRVGTLVVLPAADRPLLRTTRTAIAAVAHTLALGEVTVR